MATITKDMSIMEVVSKWPETADVFIKHGMGCLGCAAARFENIEEGAMAHGINVNALIVDLNQVTEGKKESGNGCGCGCGS